MLKKLFRRDFTMVVIGQIISLFGNNILRYALPLYLLNETGSASLYGLVLALSILPELLLAPVGGIIADRVNKRNVMVCLDFSTTALILGYTLLYHQLALVPLLVVVLMLLYGIQGAYQPAVQASIPVLAAGDTLMAGNAVINMVNSLAGILGPVLGGVVFSAWGLEPVLLASMVCFFISAVMEIFIRIPFTRQPAAKSALATAAADLRESFHFVAKDAPEIGRVGLLLTAINMVFSSLIVIGLPILVNQHLGFSQSVGNQLYGFAEGALAIGGLAGGLLSGVLGNRLKVRRAAGMLVACTLSLLPIGLVLLLPVGSLFAYWVITLSCGGMMVISTLFSIEMITYVQKITPEHLIGKVMALLSCIVMCGNPIGQAVYGALFDACAAHLYWLYFASFAISTLLCIWALILFKGVREPESTTSPKAEGQRGTV